MDNRPMNDGTNTQEPPIKKPKGRRRLLLAGSAIAVLLVLAALAAGPIMSRVEQPSYTVTVSDGVIELRTYGPMIAAEAEVRGERQAAISEGFSLIAAYIFGANKPNARIAMTAPVESQAKQTIAMTAPVIQQGTQSREGTTWSVRFIMPKSWTMETLPQPKDTRVKLVPIPSKRMAVIRFSGSADDAKIAEKTDALRQYLIAKKLQAVGEPVLAFYNPPWTLPFFRRNEIMLEIAAPA
jgi:SOUL heme-binding protein